MRVVREIVSSYEEYVCGVVTVNFVQQQAAVETGDWAGDCCCPQGLFRE